VLASIPSSARALLASAALAALAGCAPTASVQGRVIVGPGHAGQAVFALLGRLDQVTDPDDPTKTRSEFNIVAPLSVGVASAEGGSFPYLFHSLEAGTYFVGAWLDAHDDRRVTDDLTALDQFSPIVLDPAVEATRTAARDVFIGLSAPDRATLSGTLHLSAAAAGLRVSVLVLDGPLNDPKSVAVASASVGAGQDPAFTAFNVPPGNVHLVALADVGDDEDFSNDLIAISDQNPVLVNLTDRREITGLELWLDRQSPALGSVSGTITLNAPLATARYQLAVYNADPTGPTGATLLALLNVAPRSAPSIAFTVPSLPFGELFLAGLIESRENGRSLSAYRFYRGTGTEAKAIPVTAAEPAVRDLLFPMGVGRLSGTIRVSGQKNPVTQAAVLAVTRVPAGDGKTTDELRQYDVFEGTTGSDGVFTAPFEMFGLEDGEYTPQVIPDNTGGDPDWINYLYGQSPPFSFQSAPTKVTVTGGSREGVDFDVTLRP
jgi:hypothetical protein